MDCLFPLSPAARIVIFRYPLTSLVVDCLHQSLLSRNGSVFFLVRRWIIVSQSHQSFLQIIVICCNLQLFVVMALVVPVAELLFL